MTLYRQLLVMILLFLSLLLGLVYTVEFTYTKDYLSRQMSSDVQNTVTTLGLSLVPHLQSGDRIAIESVVNAVFDGGYYRRIELDLLRDQESIVRESTLKVRDVPDWFTALDLFDPVENAQILTSGWSQLAELKVGGHTGYAYQQLWQLMSGLLIGFIMAFLVLWALLSFGLKRLLRPLVMLEEKTLDIENQQFGQPLPEPKVRELRGLVNAFNRMSSKLQLVFKQQASETDDLRRKAFQDELTGIGNRAFFDAQLDQWLDEPGNGAVMLLGIPNLDEVYRQEGYQARDQLVCALNSVFSKQVEMIPGTIVARVSGKEFGAIIPGVDVEQVDHLATQILKHAENTVVDPFGHNRQVCYLGAVARQADATASLLLSQADLALQQAAQNPAHSYHSYRQDKGQMVLGREGWKQLALQAMAHDWIKFQTQPVQSLPTHQLKAVELFAFIEKDGVRYAASQFMPFIEQFGLGAKFDQYVLTQLQQGNVVVEHPVMVNLSVDSIQDSQFVGWLKDYLQSIRDHGMRFFIEVQEETAIRNLEVVTDLFSYCRRLGVGCGIDHFGHYFDKLCDISTLQPSYLKVDLTYIDAHGDYGDFARSLTNLCEVQDIEIIASRIEVKEQLESIENLPVAAYQGYINPPQDLGLISA